MQKIDVRTLDGWRLDYFTGLALGYEMLIPNNGAGPAYLARCTGRAFEPSRNLSDAEPVLARIRTLMQRTGPDLWQARANECSEFANGDMPTVAMCRALVLHKLGAEVSLPGKSAASPRISCADSYQSDSADCEDLFA